MNTLTALLAEMEKMTIKEKTDLFLNACNFRVYQRMEICF